MVRTSNTLLLAIILMAMTACQSNRPPGHLIKQDDLVPILVDLHLVYALQGTIEFRTLSREIDSVDTYSYVFDKHGIDKTLFDSTIAWFSRNPERFTDVYDEVVMQLTRKADSIRPQLD